MKTLNEIVMRLRSGEGDQISHDELQRAVVALDVMVAGALCTKGVPMATMMDIDRGYRTDLADLGVNEIENSAEWFRAMHAGIDKVLDALD